MTVMATETSETREPTGLTAHPRVAYHLRQGPNMRNNRHAVLDQALTSGRLQRSKGDALCRPARTFWGLEPLASFDTSPVDCPKCIALAERYGVTLIDPTKEAAR